MPKLIRMAVYILMLLPVSSNAQTSISPKEEIKIARIASKDNGFDVSDDHNQLEELNGPDGTEMFSGYYNIGLVVSPHVPVGTVFAPDMAMNFAIRKETSDVVDMNTCSILRYPDLMDFRRKWLKNTGNKPVSLDRIRDEVDCETLKVVTASTAAHATR